MNANDKTGEKLVDSMRKTKAAAADKSDTSQNTAGTSPKKKSQAESGKKTTARRSANGARNRGADAYQSGRRVWPD